MQKSSWLVLAIVLTLVIGASVAVPALGKVQAKPCTPGGAIDLHDVPCDPTPTPDPGSGGDAWKTDGNSGTDATNFLGTTDDVALELHVTAPVH